ncbi:MAG: carboxypeptidase-like regulatory domain-containing protein [Acidimicrobiales bacterium]
MVVLSALVTAACTGGGSGAARSTTTIVAVTTEPPPTAPPPTTSLVTVAGNPRPVTTLPAGLGPGGARIVGSVVGPDGPVAGATIRVERLVGDGAAATTLQSGNSGQWEIDSLNGGRYRIRAWRPPDLAAVTATLLFVVATQTATVNLTVNRYGDTSLVAAVSPNPPVVNQPASLVVGVSSGAVDADGILHAGGRPGALVQVALSGPITLGSPDTALTDGSGNAGFVVSCTAAGPVSGVATVATVRQALALPACAAR